MPFLACLEYEREGWHECCPRSGLGQAGRYSPTVSCWSTSGHHPAAGLQGHPPPLVWGQLGVCTCFEKRHSGSIGSPGFLAQKSHPYANQTIPLGSCHAPIQSTTKVTTCHTKHPMQVYLQHDATLHILCKDSFFAFLGLATGLRATKCNKGVPLFWQVLKVQSLSEYNL